MRFHQIFVVLPLLYLLLLLLSLISPTMFGARPVVPLSAPIVVKQEAHS